MLNIKKIQKIREAITVVPDFPKQGVNFLDVSSILAMPEIYALTVKCLVKEIKKFKFDAICALEARGFWFASSIALALKKPFIPIRKKGKLPCPIACKTYQCEYNTNAIEIQDRDLANVKTVLLLDDVAATGGTIVAAIELLKELKISVPYVWTLCSLEYLKPRQTIYQKTNSKLITLIKYDQPLKK